MTDCTTKLAPRGFRLPTIEYALLRRRRVVYATGRPSHGELIMRARRRPTAGRYVVALKHLDNGVWVTTRFDIRFRR